MQKTANLIINITVNNDGTIFSNNSTEYYLFKDCRNIFEIEGLDKYKKILTDNFCHKKLLVNLFKLNYSVFKLPLQLNGIKLTQYIFEEWRINNIHPIASNFVINHSLRNINNYNSTECEVMYCLLNGIVQDKEIYNFLNHYDTAKRSQRNISYAIAELHDKFETNNRTSLIQAVLAHDLDRYLPKTLFAPGVYDTLV